MKTEVAKRQEAPHIVLHVSARTAVIIPDDMIFEILSRLPARSVGRLRCVSKSWLSITSTLSFARAHAKRSPQKSIVIEQRYRKEFHFASADSNAVNGIALRNSTAKQQLKETSIEASWSGVLCLRNSMTHQHSLFNPLTCHSINLPHSKCQSTLFLCLYLHRSTSRYRLLRLSDDNPRKTEVLVIGESSWRPIPCRLPAFHQHPHPVDFNGCVHWLACTQSNAYRPQFRDYKVLPNTIMTFNKEKEVYNLLPLPQIDTVRNLGGNLLHLNGELGLWIIGYHFLDLWIMDKCWVKRYSVDFENTPRYPSSLFDVLPVADPWPLGVSVPVGDEELLVDLTVSREHRHLLRVNLKHGTCLVHYWRSRYLLHMSFPYEESIVHFKHKSFELCGSRSTWVSLVFFSILAIIYFTY